MIKRRYYISLKEFKKAPTSFTEKEVGSMCSCQKMSEKFIREMKDHLNWTQICYNRNINLTESFIDEMKDYINWPLMSWMYGKRWSLDFIKEHASYINWTALCQVKKFPEDFIIEMKDYIDFDNLFIYQMNDFSESFLRSLIHIAPYAFTHGFKTNETSWSKDFLRELQNFVNPNLFMNNKLHNWDIMKEFKKDLNGHSWYLAFKDMDNVDIDLILRYKENIYFNNNCLIQWVFRFKDTQYDKIKELNNYFAWCKEHGNVYE